MRFIITVSIFFFLSACSFNSDVIPVNAKGQAVRYLYGNTFEIISAVRLAGEAYTEESFNDTPYVLWGEMASRKVKIRFYLPKELGKYKDIYKESDFYRLHTDYGDFNNSFNVSVYFTDKTSFYHVEKFTGTSKIKYYFNIYSMKDKNEFLSFLMDIVGTIYHESFHLDSRLQGIHFKTGVEEERRAYIVGYCSIIYMKNFSSMKILDVNVKSDFADNDFSNSMKGKSLMLHELYSVSNKGLITKKDVATNVKLQQLCYSVF